MEPKDEMLDAGEVAGRAVVDFPVVSVLGVFGALVDLDSQAADEDEFFEQLADLSRLTKSFRSSKIFA